MELKMHVYIPKILRRSAFTQRQQIYCCGIYVKTDVVKIAMGPFTGYGG